MRVLTVNAGSSSVKVALLEEDSNDDTGFRVTQKYGGVDEALAASAPDVVGHRVVHGGPRVTTAEPATDEVLGHLEALTPLAPLHQPAAIEQVHRTLRVWPDVPEVVCPDTAFHADQPAAAATPAVPADWIERFGLRRYGFHGLSVAWSARIVRRAFPDATRVIVAHLGSGASLTAVHHGRSVDTTMGYTPLDGLVMATRSGALDPGMVLEVVRQTEDLDGVVRALETQAGLLGLTGSADMREVLRRRDDGDPACALGYAVYEHSLRGRLAAMVAALGGLDVLALTGGVGEASAMVRRSAVDSLGFIGLCLDEGANHRLDGDHLAADGMADLTGDGSSARVVVVAAREDVMIARSAVDVLNG